MKLHYFVTVLSLKTLKGKVCVHMSGEVDSFNAHCSALIAVAVYRI